jgi:hypothetical protein
MEGMLDLGGENGQAEERAGGDGSRDQVVAELPEMICISETTIVGW